MDSKGTIMKNQSTVRVVDIGDLKRKLEAKEDAMNEIQSKADTIEIENNDNVLNTEQEEDYDSEKEEEFVPPIQLDCRFEYKQDEFIEDKDDPGGGEGSNEKEDPDGNILNEIVNTEELNLGKCQNEESIITTINQKKDKNYRVIRETSELLIYPTRMTLV